MSCVAAVVVVALMYRLFETQQKARNYVLIGIVAVQAVQLWMGTDYRWNETPWDKHWINLDVPAKLASEPNLYLTMGTPTNSFLAPYLNPHAGMINFFGLYTLDPKGANGVRVRSLVAQYAPHIRVLVRGKRLYRTDEHRNPTKHQIDDALAPYALSVDEKDCATITVYGLPPELDFTIASSMPEEPQARDRTYLVSCHVIPDNTDYSAYMTPRRNADLALDHLEDACPKVFQPRRAQSEYSEGNALRRYGGSDLIAWVSNGALMFRQLTNGGDVVNLGPETDWTLAPREIQCDRRNGRFFANFRK
jgi:hypothetical protein